MLNKPLHQAPNGKDGRSWKGKEPKNFLLSPAMCEKKMSECSRMTKEETLASVFSGIPKRQFKLSSITWHINNSLWEYPRPFAKLSVVTSAVHKARVSSTMRHDVLFHRPVWLRSTLEEEQVLVQQRSGRPQWRARLYLEQTHWLLSNTVVLGITLKIRQSLRAWSLAEDRLVFPLLQRTHRPVMSERGSSSSI